MMTKKILILPFSAWQAGLLCKLDSRCSVLAATNPKEDGNPEDALEFIGLASPLLSRFDLVLMLMDVKNPEWDRWGCPQHLEPLIVIINLGNVIALFWAPKVLRIYVAFISDVMVSRLGWQPQGPGFESSSGWRQFGNVCFHAGALLT